MHSDPSTDRPQGVLIIYTGGTIGSLPKDPADPLSPLVPAPLDDVLARLPTYDAENQRLLLGDTWIRLGTRSWTTPLDSSNISLEDWKEMAAVVESNDDAFEGFVILHGTDTLAYTASALAFMLEGLRKPVVLTGSQLPIGRTRSDAVQNLISSLQIAAARSLGSTVIPEVTVFFRDRLLRGCRTTKTSASSFTAFDSPNTAPLVTAGEHLVVTGRLRTTTDRGPLRIIDRLDANVASIGIFPGMDNRLLQNLLATEGLRGVVLQTFGTGNGPTTRPFLDTLARAIDDGTMIVNVTQCLSGEVELGLYDASVGMLSRGVVSGMDMTVEAALSKMFVILGDEDDIDVAADRMQIDLRGEQRQSLFHLHFPAAATDSSAVPLTVAVQRPMVQGQAYKSASYDAARLDKALLRVLGLSTVDGEDGLIEFKAYLDCPEACVETAEKGHPKFLGRTRKSFRRGDEANAFFTITHQALEAIHPERESTVTLVPLADPLRWSRLNIALFCHPTDTR